MDWNNDGLTDLICGEYDGTVHLFLNVGSAQNPVLTNAGRVQVGVSNIDVGSYSMPFTGDWNADGLFDLFVGDANGKVPLYLNDGTAGAPHFSTKQFVKDGGVDMNVGYNAAPVWADLDGDTLPDMILGEGPGKIRFFENQGVSGAPLFSGSEELTVGGEAIELYAYSRPFLVDWDNDGDLDIVTGQYSSIPVLYRNDPTPVVLPGFNLIFHGPMYVPSTGGTISFEVGIQNGDTQPMTFDFFTTCMVGTFAGSSIFLNPVLNYRNITLNPGQTVRHTFSQPVPAAAPSGSYDYTVYVGDSIDWIILRTDSFYFYKW